VTAAAAPPTPAAALLRVRRPIPGTFPPLFFMINLISLAIS
jgi:hypothetical protein